MRFLDLAATSAAVTAASGRRVKIELLAGALRGLAPDEIAAGAGYLAGELRQRQTGVGWASLRDLPPSAAEPRLSVVAVDAAIGEISTLSGPGSQARRRQLLWELFAAATAEEQRLLVGLFSGELRQGAQAGLLAEAVALAASVAPASVRRAVLLAGDLRAVAVAALTGGAAALAGFSLEVGRPLAPMLAQSAPGVVEALAITGQPAVVDAKLDGIRVQVHRDGREVAVFTRGLDDITARVPGVVAAVQALPVRTIVLDGEAIVLDEAGRPRPFQETSSRAATRGARRRTGNRAGAIGVGPADGPESIAVTGPGEPAAVASGDMGAGPATGGAAADPAGVAGVRPGLDGVTAGSAGPVVAGSVLAGAAAGSAGVVGVGSQLDATATGSGAGAVLRPYFFDLLHLDGADLLDEPGTARWAALSGAVPPELLVARRTVPDAAAAKAVFDAALAAGHEGVVVKAPGAPYDAGRRGGAWVKVKPRHTLDLVVLAVEWGHGRRRGLLSNLHLGARDPQTGGFVMLGKTFKGLTDEMLRWQTERFLQLAVDRGDWVVRLRPEQVVEIAFDGVQTSPRYPGGVALRFARVLRYRHDKRPEEADTIDAVRAIHTRPAAGGAS